MLADETRSEAELCEAAAVLAQITAPWVEDNHTVNGLGQFLSSLVRSLTRESFCYAIIYLLVIASTYIIVLISGRYRQGIQIARDTTVSCSCLGQFNIYGAQDGVASVRISNRGYFTVSSTAARP